VAWIDVRFIRPKKEEKFYETGVRIENNNVVLKSGTGELYFSRSTGKPVGGTGYNPDDWRDRPEFVGKSEEELIDMIRGIKMENYNEIKEEVEYWEKISENLEDELMSLDLDNIDLELAKAFFTAFGMRAGYMELDNICSDNVVTICHDGFTLFADIMCAIDDGEFEKRKEEFRIELDEFKMIATSYDLSVPPEEHKEAFQKTLRERIR
jgi:hypothetical protein